MKQILTGMLIMTAAAFLQENAGAHLQGNPANSPHSNSIQSTASHASTGKVRIASAPPGAEVSIDGKAAGQTPLSVDLPVGDHEIMVKKDGYRLWKLGLKMAQGENSRIGAHLRKVTDPEGPK